MVEAQQRDRADRVVGGDLDVPAAPQHRQKVADRLLVPVHLAALQGGRGGGGIGNGHPFDAVEMHDLAARRAIQRLGPRHVALVPRIGRAVAGRPFLPQEAERARSRGIADLLRRRGLRDALRHDEGHGGGGLADRFQQQRKGPLEAKPEGPVVEDRHLVGERHQRLAEAVPRRPAAQARHAVLRAHRLAVVEAEPLAQPDGGGPAIGGDLVSLRHLRPRPEGGVERVERVVDHVAVVAHHVAGRTDRIDGREDRVRDEAQRPAGGLRQGGRRPRRAESAGQRRGAGPHDIAPRHHVLFLPLPHRRVRAGRVRRRAPRPSASTASAAS